MSKKNKIIVSIVAILLMTTIYIGSTSAILIDGPKVKKNTFTSSEVTTSVVETIEGNAKKEVKIKNTGDTEAYIRAAIVVTWKDANGNVYGTEPVAGNGADYSISFGSGWELAADGFYYWTSPVAPGATTGVLIESCTYNANAPEGYSLNVEIIGSGIQSVPTSAVTSAWSSGIKSVTDKTLDIKVN